MKGLRATKGITVCKHLAAEDHRYYVWIGFFLLMEVMPGSFIWATTMMLFHGNVPLYAFLMVVSWALPFVYVAGSRWVFDVGDWRGFEVLRWALVGILIFALVRIDLFSTILSVIGLVIAHMPAVREYVAEAKRLRRLVDQAEREDTVQA